VQIIGGTGAPVAPGLHVLTVHKGKSKGQKFDWVSSLGWRKASSSILG
jgi:hypothetical protein